MEIIMPLEIKGFTIPHSTALTHSIEHTRRHGAGSTFKQRYTVLKSTILLHKWPKRRFHFTSMHTGRRRHETCEQWGHKIIAHSGYFWQIFIRRYYNFGRKSTNDYYCVSKTIFIAFYLRVVFYRDGYGIHLLKDGRNSRNFKDFRKYYTGAQSRINTLANCNHNEHDRV